MAITESNRTIFNDSKKEVLAEQTSPVFTADLVDQDKVAIPIAQLVSLSLDYYNKKDGVAIGNRTALDIKNNPSVLEITVSGTGKIQWVLLPTDTKIEGKVALNESEVHVATFKWKHNGIIANMQGSYDVEFLIQNTRKTT